MSEEKEVIQVFSEEQIEVLPEEIQTEVAYLSTNVRPSELALFNPVVQALINLEELTSIKYVPLTAEDPDNEKDHKDSIKAYKEAKRIVGSFNSDAGKAKTKMKQPYLEIGKHIVSFERACKDRAKLILMSIQAEFKPYLDAEEAKRLAVIKKKDDAINARANDALEVVASQKAQIDQVKYLNIAKYDVIMTSKAAHTAELNSLSLTAIEKALGDIKHWNFLVVVVHNELMGQDNWDKLTEAQQNDVKNDYDNYVSEITSLYQSRKEELVIKNSNAINAAKVEGNLQGQLEATKAEDVPQEPVSFVQDTDAPAPPPINEIAQPETFNASLHKKTDKEVIVELVSIVSDSARQFGLTALTLEDPLCVQIAKDMENMLGKAVTYINPKIDSLK